MNLGNILKLEREKQGLSKRQLALKAEVSATVISFWESGKRKMTTESADKIFKALGITISIGGTNE